MKIKELFKKITGQDKLDIIIENQNKASNMNARIILQTKFEAQKAKGEALLIEQQYKEEIKQVEKNLKQLLINNMKKFKD